MSLPYPHFREQKHKVHFCYLICPLMSPQVLSGLCLFPDLESSWERSSAWDKGELQMKEIWPPPSGIPLSGFPLCALAWEEGQGHV